MKFTKMQGTGNDYIYINCFEETVTDPACLARMLSDRHFGIGSDGLILICPSETADCRMRMFNEDGSEGTMCGNGIRCVGKYIYDHGIARREHLTVETGSGIKALQIHAKHGKADTVTVDMGEPLVTSALPEPILVHGENREFVGISLGNPHAVYFVEDLSGLDLETAGPFYEHHNRFPDRVNSEFVQLLDRGHLRMRVWERGSGETWACGTGATASAVAANLMGLADDRVSVQLKGGELEIFWNRETNHVYMTGPAAEVFRGEIDI